MVARAQKHNHGQDIDVNNQRLPQSETEICDAPFQIRLTFLHV